MLPAIMWQVWRLCVCVCVCTCAFAQWCLSSKLPGFNHRCSYPSIYNSICFPKTALLTFIFHTLNALSYGFVFDPHYLRKLDDLLLAGIVMAKRTIFSMNGSQSANKGSSISCTYSLHGGSYIFITAMFLKLRCPLMFIDDYL